MNVRNLTYLIIIVVNYNILFAHNSEKQECHENIMTHAKELQLTKIQRQNLRKIQEEYRVKFEGVKHLMGSNNSSDREIIKKLIQEWRKKEEAVLTPKQKAKWNIICEKYKDIQGAPGKDD